MAESSAWERIIAGAQSAASSLRVKSALNPMLWLSAIISPACFVVAYFAHGIEPLETWLLIIGASPIGCTIFGFLYFMVFDPSKLQSEDYQIRHEAIEVIREKGTRAAISSASLEAIANPIHAVVDHRGDA
jgi:hypothetical protein